MRLLASARRRFGLAGLILVTFMLAVALLGPLVAPHSPTAPIGPPGSKPSGDALLGTDFLGRDLLSRVLNGGRSVVALSTITTFLATAIATALGLIAGYSRSFVSPLLMRFIDVLVTFPPLLIILVLLTGGGSGVSFLIIGVVIVLIPNLTRVVYTAAREVSVSSYVEAAVARGESTPAVLVREILPNILLAILPNIGIRFAYSIILIASVSFLGLGLQPPSSDWGLMVAENRQFINVNPWTVLAPSLMLALLSIGVTMAGDTFGRTIGRSTRTGAPIGTPPPGSAAARAEA